MTPGDEKWRPVVGYEGCYEVSDQGRVRSLDHYVIHRGSRAPKNPVLRRGRVLAVHRRADGRPVIRLFSGGIGGTMYVPALMLESFVGPRPDGFEACHNDGNAANNVLSNLRWDTKSANGHDRVKHGTDIHRTRTHCPRGHLLQEPNLVACIARRGYRQCLACSRAKAVGQKAARAGQEFDMQIESDLKYAVILRRHLAA